MADDEVDNIEKKLNVRTLTRVKGNYAQAFEKIQCIIENEKLNIKSLILKLNSIDDDNITIFSTDSAYIKK